MEEVKEIIIDPGIIEAINTQNYLIGDVINLLVVLIVIVSVLLLYMLIHNSLRRR